MVALLKKKTVWVQLFNIPWLNEGDQIWLQAGGRNVDHHGWHSHMGATNIPSPCYSVTVQWYSIKVIHCYTVSVSQCSYTVLKWYSVTRFQCFMFENTALHHKLFFVRHPLSGIVFSWERECKYSYTNVWCNCIQMFDITVHNCTALNDSCKQCISNKKSAAKILVSM